MSSHISNIGYEPSRREVMATWIVTAVVSAFAIGSLIGRFVA